MPTMTGDNGLAVLKRAPGLSNFNAQFGPIYDSTDEFGRPDVGFMARAGEAISPGLHAIEGLRRAAAAQQEIGRSTRAANLKADQDFGLDEADYAADVADLAGERTAGREFLPNAAALHARGRQEQTADLATRFVRPAEIGADATLGAAGLEGDWRTGAAQIDAAGRSRDARLTAIYEGLNRAIAEFVRRTGDLPTPEQIGALQQSILTMPK